MMRDHTFDKFLIININMFPNAKPRKDSQRNFCSSKLDFSKFLQCQLFPTATIRHGWKFLSYLVQNL